MNKFYPMTLEKLEQFRILTFRADEMIDEFVANGAQDTGWPHENVHNALQIRKTRQVNAFDTLLIRCIQQGDNSMLATYIDAWNTYNPALAFEKEETKC